MIAHRKQFQRRWALASWCPGTLIRNLISCRFGIILFLQSRSVVLEPLHGVLQVGGPNNAYR